MKKILMKKSKRYVFVDDEDYDFLKTFSWYLTSHGYAATNVRKNKGGDKNKTALMHRMIMNTPRGKFTDHKDGNRLNNTKENLRICSQSENKRNGKTKRKYKGVYSIQRARCIKYRAIINVDYKAICLGTFLNEEDAAKAYDAAASKYFGEFALTNFS